MNKHEKINRFYNSKLNILTHSGEMVASIDFLKVFLVNSSEFKPPLVDF